MYLSSLLNIRTRNATTTKIARYISLLLVMAVVLSIFITNIQAREIALPASSDPFAEFTDVFVGQSRNILEAHGFSCSASFFGNTNPSSGETCILWSQDNSFKQIRVFVVNDVIKHVAFITN